MIDYNTITTVSKNFNYEQAIKENESLKYNNKILLATGVVVGICFLGVAVYLINEEMQYKKYYYQTCTSEKKPEQISLGFLLYFIQKLLFEIFHILYKINYYLEYYL